MIDSVMNGKGVFIAFFKAIFSYNLYICKRNLIKKAINGTGFPREKNFTEENLYSCIFSIHDYKNLESKCSLGSINQNKIT
jgi:hypothetical protein